jgi:hypothetical protein
MVFNVNAMVSSLLCWLLSLLAFVDDSVMLHRNCIHDGLLDSDGVIRKRALFLLRESLFAIGFGGTTAEPFSATSADEFWHDVTAAQLSSSQRLPLEWEVYIALLESLEDFPQHLVAEVWPHHELLFQSDAVSSSSAFCVPNPATPHTIPFWWSSIVLHRAFTSSTVPVKKRLLTQFFELHRSLDGGARKSA